MFFSRGKSGEVTKPLPKIPENHSLLPFPAAHSLDGIGGCVRQRDAVFLSHCHARVESFSDAFKSSMSLQVTPISLFRGLRRKVSQ